MRSKRIKMNEMIKILAIDENHDNLINLKALVNETFPSAIFLTAFNYQWFVRNNVK